MMIRNAGAPLLRNFQAVNTAKNGVKTVNGNLLIQHSRGVASVLQSFVHSGDQATELSQAQPPSKIPGPRRWPLIGSHFAVVNHKAFAKDKVHLVWEACFEEYGPIFRLDTPGQRPVVYIYLPEHVEHLLKVTSENSIRPFFDIVATVRDADRTHFRKGESGLLSATGDQWLRVRRLTQNSTLKMKTVFHYLPKMDSIASAFVDEIYSQRDENNQLPEDFLQLINRWALENLAHITFGSRGNISFSNSGENSRMMQDIHDFLYGIREVSFEPGALWRWLRTPAYKKFEKAHNKILGYVKESVKKSMQSLEEKERRQDSELDLIEKYLTTPGLKLSDIYAVLTDFLIAGIDNTSSTVAFTMLNLARNPDKQAKLQEELDRVLDKDSNTLTPDQMARLSYTKATVKETLRMNPVSFGVVRTLHKDIALGGYKIPKGFNVFAMTKHSGMMEEYFQRPKEFLPERWLRDRPLGPLNAYSSIPFGIGSRMCIARRFAEQEIYTILVRIFHKYNIEWTYGDVGTRMFCLLYPDKPLKFTMTRRT